LSSAGTHIYKIGKTQVNTRKNAQKINTETCYLQGGPTCQSKRKYLTCLKTIKRPRINNSQLLDGVNRVSRSIEGCIKLAESTLGSSTSQQDPEALNLPKERSGDILSGIDRVDSKFADCIKTAEGTLQNLKQKPGGGI